MSSTLKFVHEEVLGGVFNKADSILPDVSSLQLPDNTITKLAVLVGGYALIKWTWGTLRFFKPRKSKLSKDLNKLPEKYGQKSWAIIGDIDQNQQYAKFLARRNINLILLGSDIDVNIGKELIMAECPLIEVETFAVDWEEDHLNENLYKNLASKFEYYDISFLVTPKVRNTPYSPFGNESNTPAFAHVFLLINTFLRKLKSRAYRSAIIVNCDYRSGKIEQGKALQNAAVSAVQCFARTLEYEIRGYCDLVIAKGSEVAAFEALGIKKVSQSD